MTKPPLDLHIFQKIRQLGLPDGEYVIVGDDVLAALGLALWGGTIEAVISEEVYDGFRHEGWQQEDHEGHTILKNDDVYKVGLLFGEWSLEDVLADALIIRGMPFINPAKLLAYKQQNERPEDAELITVLKKYVAAN